MFLNRKIIFAGVGIVIAAIALVVAWWLLLPLFIDKTVEEEFPFAFNATVPTDMTRMEVEQVMAKLAKMNTEDVQESMDDLMMKAAGSDSSNVSQLTILKTGSFRDADSVHEGSGKATIYEGPDGARVLRLEDFNSTNGPDLYVILSPTANPQSREEVSAPGFANLGKLKGNIGNQNYAIPNDVEIPAQGSIVIYCRAFHVIFSVASLQDTG